MKTCKQCKDDACPEMGVDMPGCDDFTSTAVEEALPDWQPTLADFEELERLWNNACNEITRLKARLDGYENAVAELVRWAQGDEAP